MSNVQRPTSKVKSASDAPAFDFGYWTLDFGLPKQNTRSFATVLSLALLLTCFVTQSFARRTERLIDSWRPTNYNVSLRFNDRLTEITNAKAEITVSALRDISLIDLDFGELPIDSVTVNNQATPYERSPGRLNIKLPSALRRGTSLVITIAYHGKPKGGLVSTNDKWDKPSAVGDNWPDRVHHWIPSLDHPAAKATVTFSITAPAHNEVVANGKLDRVDGAGDTARTWTYTEAVPISPYCMIIAVGEFARVEPLAPAVTPLFYYVPRLDQNLARNSFAPAVPSLKFFSQTVAPYPYEKLALIVGATRFGGMENSSAIVFPNGVLEARPQEPLSSVFKIREGIVEVIAHEIAHQWFGDSVTASTWSDLWLSEGFADYFAGLFIQRYEGEPAFQRYMKQEAETYFNYENRTRTPIHDTETEDLFKLLNANNYQKGAWVLHMLRSELGDANFFRGIRLYYEAHKNSTATSEDLRAAFEKASGRDLKSFFASWIYGAGHPSYDISSEWTSQTKQLRLVVKQLQPEPAFPNALPIDIVTAAGKRRIVLNPTGKQTVEEIRLDSAPTAINLDPDNTILKETSGN